MEMKMCRKAAFSVIGKLGSTADGEGFIQRLWEEANAHFPEVEPLAKRDGTGAFCGFWGLMSDVGMNFLPWEDGFTRGLYLAGVEVLDDAQPPEGWVKWTSPAYEYRVVEAGQAAFEEALKALEQDGLALAGAVYDFTEPGTGTGRQYFPVRRL